MILEIDFNSDEALYIQLRNQIVIGIATSQLSAGDSLPSVRQLADRVFTDFKLLCKKNNKKKMDHITCDFLLAWI